jgi:pimeloyl-ACP methyl ester carboxylesterase
MADTNNKNQSIRLPNGNTVSNSQIYEAAVAPIDIFDGHDYPATLYGNPDEVKPNGISYYEFDAYKVYDPEIVDREYVVATDDGNSFVKTTKFKIAYSFWGRKNTGILMICIHGVPANQTQWYDVCRRLALVGYRVVALDMLTMGKSTKPLFDDEEKADKLRWIYDREYIRMMVDDLFGPKTKFIFAADDWGTAILQKFIEKYYDRVIFFYDQDGIRGGAYPVPEIEAIGRAALLPLDLREQFLKGLTTPAPGTFQDAMKGSDQTVTQILKTMASTAAGKYDQWSMRSTLNPFFDTDYERPDTDARGAYVPVKSPPKFFALRSMADRAGYALRTSDLLPYHPEKNKDGIDFVSVKTYGLFMSGDQDKMMSRNVRFRYTYWMPQSRIFSDTIPNADHFAGFDRPEYVATQIIAFHNFLIPPGNPGAVPKAFLGFDGIFKGNEREEAQGYDKLYSQ